MDPNHKPTSKVITNPKEDRMLEGIIDNSDIFKRPYDIVLARDTSYVESFNNVMNTFQDKRMSVQCQFYIADKQGNNKSQRRQDVGRYH